MFPGFRTSDSDLIHINPLAVRAVRRISANQTMIEFTSAHKVQVEGSVEFVMGEIGSALKQMTI